MKTPQNYRSPLHVKIPRETLVFMKKHQANIKKKPLFWWIVTSTLFFLQDKLLLCDSGQKQLVALYHWRKSLCTTMQDSSPETGIRFWDQVKKNPIHWLCLGSVPHMLDTCLGNCSNIISIRNSYCLWASMLIYTMTAVERKVPLS